MKESKYKINQKVWSIENDKAGEFTITTIVKYKEKDEYYYGFGHNRMGYIFANAKESSIFPDKESFIKSL